MDYRKYEFGTIREHSTLAVDDKLRLVAVASNDGVLKIYSHLFDKVQSINIGTVLKLQFIKGEGCLIVFCDESKIHVLSLENIQDSFQWTTMELDKMLPIYYLHVCKGLDSTMNNKTLVHLLTVDRNNLLELILIKKSKIIYSKKFTVRTCSGNLPNDLIQIAEVDYSDNILSVLILWEDEIRLMKFSYYVSNEEEECYISFDLKLISSSYINFEEINYFKVINPYSFIVTTLTGKYGILRYVDEDQGQFIMEELLFPYGPFPCKKIDKCVMSLVPRLKGECFIFCGGLPAVTYKDLHSLSVAVKDEPEICFTFHDPIVDFDIFQMRNHDGVSRLTEIIVLTKTELLSIVNDNGLWECSNNYHFSPISRSEVLAVSNVIELSCGCDFLSNGHTVDEDEELPLNFFATFHKDSFITLWTLSQDKSSKYSQINLDLFFNENITEKKEKKILWPKFQKSGLWNINKGCMDMKMGTLKLFNDRRGLHLLCSVNGSVIFNFEILFNKKKTSSKKTLDLKELYKHVKINFQEDIDLKIKINEKVSDIPHEFELKSLVTFNGIMDLSHIDIVWPMLIFGGVNGVGLLNIISGKHSYLFSEDLAVVHSDQRKKSFSGLITNRIRRTKSFESAKLKSNSELKLSKINVKVKSIEIVSFYLFQKTEIMYDLCLGFTDGLVMILSFITEVNEDINISSTYRSIHSRSKDKVLLLSVLKANNLTSPKSSRVKFKLEEYNSIRGSIDSTKEGSVSTDSKSTHISSESDKLQVNSLSRTKTLKWPIISQKMSSNDVLLIRCDKLSIKIIDYLKLKTRFKYKINEQLRKSEENSENMKKQVIIEVKIVDSDDNVTKCLVILSNQGMVTKLSIPSLEPLLSCALDGYIPTRSLVSINKDMIVVPMNISMNSELTPHIIIWDQRRQKTSRYRKNDKLKSFELDFVIPFDGESTEIDFMRCAEPSVTSLLW